MTHNNYPWGWTMAGNTRSSAGSEKCTKAAWRPCVLHWPNGPSRPGRSATSSPCHRHLRHGARAHRSRRPRDDRLGPPVASRQRQLLLPPRCTWGQGAARRLIQHFEMFGPGPFTTMLEGGDVSPGRPSIRRTESKRALRRRCVGALSRRRRRIRDQQRGRRTPERLNEMIDLCGPRPNEIKSSPRQPRAVGARQPKPTLVGIEIAFATSKAARRSRIRRGQRAQPLACAHRRGQVPEGVTPEGTCSPWVGLGGWSLQFRGGRPATSQSLRKRTPHHQQRCRPRRRFAHPQLRVHQGRRARRARGTQCRREIVAQGTISRFTPGVQRGGRRSHLWI